jgi:predicted nucleic acid-binding protein
MALSVVIDASAALKWQFKDESESEEAVALLADYDELKVGFIVPRLFYYEIANAISIAVRRERMAEDVGEEILDDMVSLEASVVDSTDITRTAYRNARKFNISVYDSVYVTLAEKNKALFYTGDRKLYSHIRDKSKFIRWIGDYRRIG